MSLFGAMNWLYTWHNSESDPDAETLARQISDLFLQGVVGDGKLIRAAQRKSLTPDKAARPARELSRGAHE